ncbi:MAG: PaaX family transcriptional regulator C-terminal domain-containing protein [Acidimicrobiales bacterium]
MELRDDTRPLTARSIVASTLLGVRPSRLPARSLIASAALFGVAEGTVRTALSRMVAAGELVGDEGSYALAGPFLARQERQDESRSGAIRPWSGGWELAVVESERRSAGDRVALRAAMRALRLAELREGVWLRPDNLDPDRLPEARAVVGEQCLTMTGWPADAVAARLWDLDEWATTARVQERRLADVAPRLGADPDVLRPAFLALAATLRHLQADPLLPVDLLPPDWPGPALRASHDQADVAFKAVWTARLRAP